MQIVHKILNAFLLTFIFILRTSLCRKEAKNGRPEILSVSRRCVLLKYCAFVLFKSGLHFQSPQQQHNEHISIETRSE